MIVGITLTELAAFWGAVVGTGSLVVSCIVAYLHWREHKPRVRVRLGFSLLPSAPFGYDSAVAIEAQNPGHQPVTLTMAGWDYPGGETAYVNLDSTQNLPVEIGQNEGYDGFIEKQVFFEGINEDGYGSRVRLKPFFSGAAGRKFEGSSYVVDTEKKMIRESGILPVLKEFWRYNVSK